jgi:histidinol-phosphate aminotransferase
MNRIESLARKNIRALIPYSSARDDFQGNRGIFLDANENPYGTLNRYPDPHHKKLRSSIGKLKGLPPENIFLGNGSDEVIDLLMRVFCVPGTDKCLTFTPTYGMYEVAAAVNDLTIVRVPLDGKFDIDINQVDPYLSDKTIKLIFICSPNNPTGNSFSSKTITDIIKRFSGIVVIDEAYIDFSERGSFLPFITSYDNLVVMQTFSKAWGAAAARVGIAFACESITRYLYKVKPPYNISGLNQREALRRLENPGRFRKQITAIISERKRMEKVLSKIDSVIDIFPSDANFLLVKVKNADLIYKKLTAREIIVRNRSSVVDNCLRITVGTKEENNILVKALKSIKV